MSRKKTAVAAPNELAVVLETPDGEQIVTIDLDAELGDLTPAEFMLFNSYVLESGFLPDHEKAAAGAAVLVLLSRKVDVDHDSLLKAVI